MGFDMPNLGDLVDKGKEVAGKAVKEVSQGLEDAQKWTEDTAARYESRREEQRALAATKIDDDDLEDTADFAERTRNPEELTRYLAGREGTMGKELQTRMLEFGDNCYFTSESFGGEGRNTADQETVKDFYANVERTGGELGSQCLARYIDEVDKGHWGNRAPEYLVTLNPTQQPLAYSMNPIAYARTFPASELVKGEVLAQIVKDEIDWLENQSPQRSANVGQIGRRTDSNILANPNLTREQRHAICEAVKSTDISELTPDADIALDKIVRNVATSKNSPKDFVSIVRRFYGPRFDNENRYMSDETYREIEARANRIKENGNIGTKDGITEDDYQMLLGTKRFTPNGKTESEKTGAKVS